MTRRLIDDRTKIHRASRREIKYVLDREVGLEAAACLDAQGVVAVSPQGERSWGVRSVYYDDDLLTLTQRAHAHPESCVKVRTRDYCSLGSNGAPERIWVEVKSNRGDRVEKIRYPVLREELDLVFAAGAPADDVDETSLRAHAHLASLCEGRALSPVAEVRYQRRAAFLLEGRPADEELERVTLDSELLLRRVTLGETELHPDEELGSDVWFLEVKSEQRPPWLARTLEGRSSTRYSKFLIATRGLV